MRFSIKIAALLFLLLFAISLYSQSEPDNAFTLDDWLRYYEEFLMSEDDYDSPEESEDFTAEEALYAEDSFFTEEIFFDDDFFFFESLPLIFEVPSYQIRSFDDVFPNLSRRQRTSAMSGNGLRYYFTKDDPPRIVPNPDFKIDVLEKAMNRDPSHIIQALILVPYSEREFDLLDIYNTLGRIENLKDYPIVLNGNNYYVFSETNRIESSTSRRAIPDPPPAETLPFSETIFLRLREETFGNLFIRGEISVSMYGITYDMTNFTDVRYFIIPVMRAERFSTILYLEPVMEGVLIYSVAGFYLPDFVASRVDLTASINRRIDVFINWITDGLRAMENPMLE